jgi:BASS family bile acid:Na+ symporter
MTASGQETLIVLILGFLMFGIGLSLQIQDFIRVISKPKAILTALVCQSIFLPVVAFALTLITNVRGELAVGMMLLAAAPGGPTANLMSHLAPRWPPKFPRVWPLQTPPPELIGNG